MESIAKLWNLPCDSHSGIVHCIAQIPAISNALYSPLYFPHHLLFCAQFLFFLHSLPIHLQVIIIHTATHITDTIFLMSYMLLLLASGSEQPSRATGTIFLYPRTDGRGHIPYTLLNQRSRGNGGGACAQSGNLPHTPSPFIFHSVFLTVTHGFRASYIQPTWKAWMGPPLQQSVTQPVIARYVRLSASPCRLSRAHASGERVHAAAGQRVHAGCRSCVAT